jgi:hypothetical protein
MPEMLGQYYHGRQFNGKAEVCIALDITGRQQPNDKGNDGPIEVNRRKAHRKHIRQDNDTRVGE